MTRLVLHIGAHKTGTTFVQKTLDENSARLRARGVLYPRACRYHHAQHRLAFALRGVRDPTAGDHPDPAREADALRAEIDAAGCEVALVSSEELFGLPEERIRFLRDRFGDAVEIIAFVRSPDDTFVSTYNQVTKEPRNRVAFQVQRLLREPERICPQIHYLRHLERWETVFGRARLSVFQYERQDPLDAVLEKIGVERATLRISAASVNRSISTRALEMIRISKTITEDAAVIRRVFDLAVRAFPPDDCDLLTAVERNEIRARFAEANRALAVRYGLDPSLYEPWPDAENAPDARCVLTRRDVAQILVTALQEAPPRR